MRKKIFQKKLIEDSTGELFRLHGWKNIPQFIHGYFYLGYIQVYVGALISGFNIFKRIINNSNADRLRPFITMGTDGYHGKVINLEDAKKIVTLQQDIAVPQKDAERVIPFEVANRIILRNPEAIVVMDCICRKVSKNHCEPASRCLIIGEPFASFVMTHEKEMNPRRITQHEAVQLLEEVHKKGLIHNAYFRDCLGDQFYAICNCCTCCCMGVRSQKLFDSLSFEKPVKELAPSGYVAVIDQKKCNACSACATACPFEIITVEEEHAVISSGSCMGCGICKDACPEKAIKLKRDPFRGIPLDIHALVPEIYRNTREVAPGE